jgi:hypothetical protein
MINQELKVRLIQSAERATGYDLVFNIEALGGIIEDYANRRCVEELEKLLANQVTLETVIGDRDWILAQRVYESIARLRGEQPTPNER